MSDQVTGQPEGETLEPTPPPTGLLERLETYLKLVTAGLGVVAAMGYPAVYTQLSRFGVPSTFVSYEAVLRAGVFPALVMIFLFLYLHQLVKEFRARSKPRYVMIPSIGVLPLLLLPMLLWLVGSLSVLVLFVWATGWVLSRPVAWMPSVNPTNRQLLAVGGFILVVAVSILQVVALRTRAWWAKRDNWLARILGFLAPEFVTKNEQDTGDDNETDTGGDTNEGSQDLTLAESWLTFPIGLVVSLVSAYAVKLMLHVWDPSVSQLLNHRFVVIVGLVSGLSWGIVSMVNMAADAFPSESEGSGSDRRQRLSLALLVAFSIATGVGSVWAYSSWIYPILPHGLGGGKPTEVELWVDADYVPSPLAAQLGVAATPAGDVAHLSRLFLLYQTSAEVVLVTAEEPPASGVVIPRAGLRAISW